MLNIKNAYESAESIYFINPNIRNTLPKKFKDISRLVCFDQAIKMWQPENCIRKLGKLRVQDL